jgi:organic radical activating enzyme
MKADHGDGESLWVVQGSPFLTIQGEGPHCGHPAVFIRLHGCHLRCFFCDTDFDSANDQRVDIDELCRQVMKIRGTARLVVITGGEPMRQNILPLCQMLYGLGFKIQIETSGSYWIKGIDQGVDIVCSPKTPTIHPMIYDKADAFKYVIDHAAEYNLTDPRFGYIPIMATQSGARSARLATPREGAPVYLSPCDRYDENSNRLNHLLVATLAMKYNCIAGIQLHKILHLD